MQLIIIIKGQHFSGQVVSMLLNSTFNWRLNGTQNWHYHFLGKGTAKSNLKIMKKQFSFTKRLLSLVGMWFINGRNRRYRSSLILAERNKRRSYLEFSVEFIKSYLSKNKYQVFFSIYMILIY
jgi:hypothetical protein